MENLIDTLLIFNKLSIEIGYKTLAMVKAEVFDPKKINQLGTDMAVLNSLMEMIIIESCSFVDEYEQHFGVTTEEKYKNQIVEIKQICKPIINKIKGWKDLRLIRNSFLAHNLRTKDRKMIFRNEISYNAPRNVYEVELLNHLIQIIFKIIYIEFREELEFAKTNFKLKTDSYIGLERNTCFQTIDNIILDVNEKLRDIGRKYSINLK